MSTKVNIVTTVYGKSFHQTTPAWCRHVRGVSAAPISLLSLDGHRAQIETPDVSVVTYSLSPTNLAWGSGDIHRLEYIIEQLAIGVTCVQLDLDVYLKKPIQQLVDLDYDFIISRAFTFPPAVARSRGFVMCTGFFIAKPESVRFCRSLNDAMRGGAYGRRRQSILDQFVLNMMLKDAAWSSVAHVDGEWRTTFHVCDYDGTRICVLGTDDITRDGDLRKAYFGSHHKDIAKLYRRPWLSRTQQRATVIMWLVRRTRSLVSVKHRAEHFLRSRGVGRRHSS